MIRHDNNSDNDEMFKKVKFDQDQYERQTELFGYNYQAVAKEDDQEQEDEDLEPSGCLKKLLDIKSFVTTSLIKLIITFYTNPLSILISYLALIFYIPYKFIASKIPSVNLASKSAQKSKVSVCSYA